MAITIKAKAKAIVPEDKNEWSLSIDIMLKEQFSGNGNVVYGEITEKGVQSASCGYFCKGYSRRNIYINSFLNRGTIYKLTLNTGNMSLQGQLLKREDSGNPFLISLKTVVVGRLLLENVEIHKED